MDKALKQRLYKHLTKAELIDLLIKAEEGLEMKIVPTSPIIPTPSPWISPTIGDAPYKPMEVMFSANNNNNN